jgi:uncharacterized membrane protein HdeD (DUF308 family)
MDLQKKIKLLGIASIIIGCITTLLCVTTIQGLFYAIPFGFVGMICSGVYVFIDTRNEINKKKITPGIIGLILSSTPVLFMLSLMIMHRFNS